MRIKYKMYKTMSECSLSENISMDILAALKRKALNDDIATAAGFKLDGRINWDFLKVYMDKHINDIDIEEDDDKYLKYRGIRMEAAAGIAQIQLEKERGNVIDKIVAEDIIKSIAINQKTILKNKLTSELPPQLLGLNVTEMTVILDKTVNDICKLMQDIQL